MQNLATIENEPIDGFAKHQTEKRVIRGRILKFVDGRCTVDGQPFSSDRQLLVQDVAQVGQYFPEEGPPESFFINEENPISQIAELNNSIPKKDWRIGLSGTPEEPWKLNAVVYLIDETDGAVYTMINSTVGMRRAVENLCSQVEITRKLRGAPVLPIVKVGNSIMKTKFGTKARPSFEIVGWKGLASQAVARPFLESVKAPSAGEIVQDGIPTWEDDDLL